MDEREGKGGEGGSGLGVTGGRGVSGREVTGG